mmetsp:Transcript_19749/g.55514  ORF Transcript_19749/g.55514 Transcript_19749/m.55514 type:complete len:213 (+) Transcript_19749:306-944(+)
MQAQNCATVSHAVPSEKSNFTSLKSVPTKRVTTGACETCKKSHHACDQQRPRCSRCARLKAGCLYRAHKKPGRKALGQQGEGQGVNRKRSRSSSLESSRDSGPELKRARAGLRHPAAAPASAPAWSPEVEGEVRVSGVGARHRGRCNSSGSPYDLTGCPAYSTPYPLNLLSSYSPIGLFGTRDVITLPPPIPTRSFYFLSRSDMAGGCKIYT